MKFALLITWLSLLPFAAPRADVLRLAHDEASQQLRIVDGATSSAISLSTLGIGVQAGAVSADAIADRVFLVANAGASQTLYALGYARGGGIEQAALPATSRVTHLEWDGSGTPRLVGIAIDAANDSPRLFEFRAGTIAMLDMPSPDQFRFRAGVSAFRSSDDSLYLVGRQGTETQDRIFRFTLDATPTLSSALVDADLGLLELVVASDGQLYGLAHSALVGTTRLVLIDAGLAVTLRGAGRTDCCFVLAGPVAIDTADAALVALGSSPAATGSGTRLWRFDLATGTNVEGGAEVSALGLFYDSNSVLPGGDVFTDGFESGPPLPRR